MAEVVVEPTLGDGVRDIVREVCSEEQQGFYERAINGGHTLATPPPDYRVMVHGDTSKPQASIYHGFRVLFRASRGISRVGRE
jgi:hypothetical protein